MSAPLLVIAAGGTGGHMFPAQALAQEMLRRGWRVMLSTDARGARYATGFPPEVTRRTVRAATWARGGVAARLAAPALMALGAVEAAFWFLSARPAAVIGFGGYPSFPALAAAWVLRRPRLIHEQNGVLGRVNRLFAPRVDRVACGVTPLTNAPEGAALEHVGNPIRDAAREAMKTPYDPASRHILAFGGSQGASLFAQLIPEAVALSPRSLREGLSITQQAREAEVDEVRAAYAKIGVAAEVAPFFEDLPDRMAGAALVVARAGASTIAELTAIGRPSILIPYAAAMDDHQTANARPLADAGGAVLTPEDALTAETISRQMQAILDSPEKASAMAAAAKAAGAPDAAMRLADLVETVATVKGARP